MHKKLLERLRAQKADAFNRMTELQSKSAGGTVELSATDQALFNRLSGEVEELTASITELEGLVATPPPAPAAPAPTAQLSDQERLARVEAENQRLKYEAAVNRIVGSARKQHPDLPENLAQEIISAKLSVEDASQRVFDEIAKLAAAHPEQRGHHSASVTRDQRVTMRENMAAALLVRFKPKAFAELADKGREYAGLSLVEMARVYLEAAGVNTRGMSKNQVAITALRGSATPEFLSGMHTTSDFPNILLDASNKTLRRGYISASASFKQFMRQTTASDFKTINRIQVSDAPVLLPLNEHGEYKRASISDSKESYALGTYGWILSISRKVIVNDDLDALTKLPFQIGQAAARTESNIVWGIVIDNANLADGVALFHSTHGNLITSNALNNANLGKAKAAMRKQTAPKGDKLDLVPRYAIVPADLEHTLLQLLNPSQLYANASTSVVPDWIKNLMPIVEPRLDDVASIGSTTWYLAADPETIDTVEFCYLEGEEGVYIEPQVGWNVDGMEVKARIDFAAKAIDHRGMLRCDA